MTERIENKQYKIPKTSKLAVSSCLIALVGVCAPFLMVGFWLFDIQVGFKTLLFIPLVSSPVAVILGISAVVVMKRGRGTVACYILAAVGMIIGSIGSIQSFLVLYYHVFPKFLQVSEFCYLYTIS